MTRRRDHRALRALYGADVMGTGGTVTVPVAQIGPVTVTGTFAPGDFGVGSSPGLAQADPNDPTQWADVTDPTRNLASLPTDLAAVGAGRAVGAIRSGQGPGGALRAFVRGSAGIDDKPAEARQPTPEQREAAKQQAIADQERARQAQEAAKAEAQRAEAQRREKERQQREREQRRRDEKRKKAQGGYTPFLGDFAPTGGPGRPSLSELTTQGRYGGPPRKGRRPELDVPMTRAGQQGVRERQSPRMELPTRAGQRGEGYGATGQVAASPETIDVPLDRGGQMGSLRSAWSDVVGTFNAKKGERIRRRETRDRMRRARSSAGVRDEIDALEAQAASSETAVVRQRPSRGVMLRTVGVGALAVSGLVVLYILTRRS